MSRFKYIIPVNINTKLNLTISKSIFTGEYILKKRIGHTCINGLMYIPEYAVIVRGYSLKQIATFISNEYGIKIEL